MLFHVIEDLKRLLHSRFFPVGQNYISLTVRDQNLFTPNANTVETILGYASELNNVWRRSIYIQNGDIDSIAFYRHLKPNYD